MFTGIIEELGEVEAIDFSADAARLRIKAAATLSDLQRGDSISVNGVCLTAVDIEGGKFAADVMRETLDRSSLGELRVGTRVNLERAMSAQSRFGGHMVLGHVDAVGKVVSRERSEHWDWLRIRVPIELLRYIVLKGSIAIDGVSLTVNEVVDETSTIGFSLIPETLSKTVLGLKDVGETVNLEVDIMAKHIEKLLEARS